MPSANGAGREMITAAVQTEYQYRFKAQFSTDSDSFFMDTTDTKIPGNLAPCVDYGEGRHRIDGT